MGRELNRRLHVTGTLTARTALHVGAAGSDGIEADLLVARDGSGRLIVPGTSLAGALRQVSYRVAEAGDDLQEAWRTMWGAEEFALVERHGDAPASLLSVSDAAASANAEQASAVAVRDHVGIDRRLGTAAHATKYDRLVVNPGTTFTLRMMLEIPTGQVPGGPLERLLAAILTTLERGSLALGGASTRGLGRVELAGTVVREERLAGVEEILEALRARRNARSRTTDGEPLRLDGLDEWSRTESEAAPADARRVRVKIRWEPERSILVRSGRSAEAADAVPLTVAVGAGLSTFVLPGSAIKGSLRSAAERIVRTIQNGPSTEVVDASHRHHHQVNVALVNELFGAPKRPRPQGEGGRGALSVADCHAKARFPEREWREALLTGDARSAEVALRKIEGLQHVAIVIHNSLDRWTGGTVDKRLFAVLEPRGVESEEIELEVDPTRLERAGIDPLVAGALVWLVLAQLVVHPASSLGHASRTLPV